MVDLATILGATCPHLLSYRVRRAMIVEHEILEQLLDEDWPLSRTVFFLTEMGGNAWMVIARHVHEKNLSLLDLNGERLPDWRIQEILRAEDSRAEATVHCTNKGARVVA